jgi:threonine dehydratase
VLLEEDEIAAAMRAAAQEHHLILEGAGALALAASLRGGRGDRHAIVLSGAGVGAETLRALFDEAS